jgi:hypothetical protein
MKPDEITSIIPVDKIYQDSLSPAMQQIGKALESVAKTSRFLLAPFNYLAAQHDRWERYLQKVADKVETTNLIEGHPQIVIPTLEGLSLAQENSLLSEFFINLLANSIDKTKQDLAHPAFPNIIKQISHDEAVILFFLKKNSYKIREQSDWVEEKHLFFNHRTIFDEFPIGKLNYPQHIWLYMNHLNSLNLAGTHEIGNQEVIRDPITHKQTGVYINSKRQLIEFGRIFANACVPDSFSEL